MKKNNQKLCIELCQADSDSEVVAILKNAGYWDDSNSWVDYGGIENNYASIGNQQGKADAALVEKIINSIDAVLISKCLESGVSPESPESPQSIPEALKTFFKFPNGQLASLASSERTKLAEEYCGLVATGNIGKVGNPSLTVFDRGCGQEPDEFEKTFLSLNASNKIKINFVQGKFNMGSTGALPFCGDNNLQLIVSKRNPKFSSKLSRHDHWGFTVVRRERPTGQMKSSKYTYLAPNKKILGFKADSLPIIPALKKATITQATELEHGSLVKLYEYQIGPSLKTNILFDLNYRLSLLMPNMPLPVQLYERRAYSGHSFESTLAGLMSRLEDDKRDNLETGFPCSSTFSIDSQQVKVDIYTFKMKEVKDEEGKVKVINAKDNYSKTEAIVFSVNGQSHGHLDKQFFSRQKVGLGYLSNSILVHVDCSMLSNETREKVFMNSRDRLRDDPIKKKIESEIESLLNKHAGLKELSVERRKKAINERLSNEKPLEELLTKMLKLSPALSSLLGLGSRLSSPFKSKETKKTAFKGKTFPSFFSCAKEFTQTQPRNCEIGRRANMKFNTDAENDYLTRPSSLGEIKFTSALYGELDVAISLWEGAANVHLILPDSAKIGDVVEVEYEVKDDSITIPITGRFWIKVIGKTERPTSSSKSLGKRTSGAKDGKDGSGQSKLGLPDVVALTEKDWGEYSIGKEDALVIKHNSSTFDFFYNQDNLSLQQEKKIDPKEAGIIEMQFKTAMVLVGMSIIKSVGADEEGGSVEDIVQNTSKQIAPVILPMIRGLGGLTDLH